MTTTTAPKWTYTSVVRLVGPIVRCNFGPYLEISVTKKGVSIDGWMEMKPEKLAQFIALLKEAGKAYKAIGPHGDHAAAKTWVEKVNGAKP